jgi:hypothetical protein
MPWPTPTIANVDFIATTASFGEGRRRRVVRILVDGVALERLLDDEGTLAPLYDWWVLSRRRSIWDGNPYVPKPRDHAEPTDGSVPIVNCSCGIFGCGGITARIVVDGSTVEWSRFAHAEEPVTDRSFTFDRTQYFDALDQMIARR